MGCPACLLLLTCTAAVPAPATAHPAGCFRSFLQEAGIRTSQALQVQPEQQQQQHTAYSKRPRQKLPDTELALQVTLEVRTVCRMGTM
jgi:hypothetical protein